MRGNRLMVRQPPVRKRSRDSYSPQHDAGAIETSGSDIERQLHKVEAQLGLLRAQVRQAQQLASLGTAAATIAHEVNNLLTPILSYAQTALREDDPALQRKALTVTVKNVQVLVAMADRVLAIGAASEPRRREVSVRAATDAAVESLCRSLDKDGIRLVMKIEESLEVWVDELQLQQVMFNLFLNARSAMSASHNGRLCVEAEHAGDTVTIRVTDTGEGIPAQHLPHIFDPLQTSKLSNGDGPQRCAGLGLALCRDLVEENEGSIGVSSEAGQGTTFTITLPAVKPSED